MRTRRPRRPHHLALERLEDRLTPAFNLIISGIAEFSDNVSHDAAGNYTATGPNAVIQVFDILSDLRLGKAVRISTGTGGAEAGHVTWQAFQNLGDLNLEGIGRGRLTIEAAGDVTLLSQVLDPFPFNTADSLNLTVRAAGSVRVAADLRVGSGNVELAADVRPDGSGDDGSGALTVAGGVRVAGDFVVLRGADLQIDGSAAARHVEAQSSVPSRPMSVGGADAAVAGVNLTDAELVRFGAASLGVGGVGQSADVTLTTVTVAGGVSVAVEGAGRIVLDGEGVAPALGAGGPVNLLAGAGGVVPVRPASAVADLATFRLRIDTSGPVGSSSNRLRVGASTSLTVFSLAPADVFLEGLGGLRLAGIFAFAGATVDATTRGDLRVLDSVNATGSRVSLAADVGPDGSPDDGAGTLVIDGLAAVTAREAELRGADMVIGGGSFVPPVLAQAIRVRSSLPSRPMSLGGADAAVAGVNLSDAELARLSFASLVVGGPDQEGDITVDTVSRSSSGSVQVEQSATGPGKIVLVGGAGPALGLPPVTVTLAAGAVGIEARQAASVVAGTLHLVTAGSVGAVGRPLTVQVPVLGKSAVGGRLILSATGDLATAGVITVGGSLDLALAGDFFARPGDLPAGRANLLFRGDGLQLLDSGGAPIRNLVHSGFGTLALSSNSLDVTGSLTIAFGRLDGNGHSVRVAGDWVSDGAFDGTAFFTGAGPQRLSGSGLTFQNLIHTGAGVLTVADDLTVTEDFTNADGAGSVDIANRTIRVGRAWSWGTTGKLLSAGSTVILTGDENHLRGNTTFFNLTMDSPGGTLTFDAGSTQSVAGTLTLNGAFGRPLFLRSSEVGRPWRLNSTGPRSLSFLDVQDGRNGTRVALAPASSHDAGRNTGWVFPAGAQTWLGTSSRSWDDAANWTGGYAPNPGSAVTLGPSPFQPELSSPVTVRQLSLGDGSVLTLGSFGLTVTGAFANRGVVMLRGDEPVRLALGNDTTGGVWAYTGTGDGAPVTIKDFGAVDYFELVLLDRGDTPATFKANRDLRARSRFLLQRGTYDANGFRTTVGGVTGLDGGTYLAGAGTQDLQGGLIVLSGAFQGATGTVRLGGFTQEGGTVVAPSSTLFNSGDWSVTGGTFDANGGTVTFNGLGQTVTGSTTFFNLTKVVSAADTLTFAAGSTQTVAGKLTLRGASGRLLSLVSSAPGSRWVLQPLGATDVRFVDVRDAEVAGAAVLTATSSRDSGNNAGWRFA